MNWEALSELVRRDPYINNLFNLYAIWLHTASPPWLFYVLLGVADTHSQKKMICLELQL